MDNLSKKIIDNDSEYLLNLGSETIPPCKENVMTITVKKPLRMPGCQLLLLRTASLVSSRTKEIHTRQEQASNGREIYKFNNKHINYLNTLSNIVPESWVKYELNDPIIAKRKKIMKPIKKGFGPGFIAGKKYKLPGCHVPNFGN